MATTSLQHRKTKANFSYATVQRLPQQQSPQLLDIVRKFGQNTSIRGIPRILSAEDKYLRIVWLLFVIILFVCGSLHLYYILELYFDYDVVQMPTIRVRPKALFPSVTVCNQIPLSGVGKGLISSKNWNTPKQFWKKITKMVFFEVPKLNFTEEEKRILDIYFAGFVSRSSYWSNIPSGYNPQDLGFSQQDFIRSCFLVVKNPHGDEPPFRSPLCEKLGNWTLIQDQNRLNCYTYKINEDIDAPILEMEMLLYLGHDVGPNCLDCLRHDVSTQILGARVLVHAHGAYPDTQKEGFNVYPGTLTEVQFTTSNWTRMSHPYGNCRHETPKTSSIYGHNFSYTQETCEKLHVQRQVNFHCNCTFTMLPHVNVDETTFCERLDGDINNFTARGLLNAAIKTRCALTQMFNAEQDYHCPQPCHYVTYDTSTTQARWPRESMQLTIFKTQLKQQSMQNESTYMQQLHEEIVENMKTNPEKSRKLLKESNLIDQSFVTLKIKKKDYVVTDIHDKPVRTLGSTLSQIGGLSSMWMGLSFVWIVEVIDFLVRLYRFSVLKFQKTHKYSESVVELNEPNNVNSGTLAENNELWKNSTV